MTIPCLCEKDEIKKKSLSLFEEIEEERKHTKSVLTYISHLYNLFDEESPESDPEFVFKNSISFFEDKRQKRIQELNKKEDEIMNMEISKENTSIKEQREKKDTQEL